MANIQVKTNSSKDLTYFETLVKLELERRDDNKLLEVINSFIEKHPLGDITISPSINLEYNEPGLGAWYNFKCVFNMTGKTKLRQAKQYLASYINELIKDIAKEY